MDALEKLRSQNRFEETLPSGLKVTLRLPRIRDCIIAGRVPLPILKELVQPEQNGNGQAATIEEQQASARFQDEIVLRSVVAIEGEPVQLTLDDLPDILTADYDRIVELAFREQTSPLAGTPT